MEKHIDNETKHVSVVDSLMGSGKTSHAIQYMNENPQKKFIYITPFLLEVSRIVTSCETLDFKQPMATVEYGNKTKSFMHLIETNQNIASTHALFEGIGSEVLDLLRERNYHLILDEAISVLNDYRFRDGEGDTRRRLSGDWKEVLLQEDVDAFLGLGVLEVNDDNQVQWVGERLSLYDRMRDFADRGVLYYVDESALLWSFPIEVFQPDVFQSVSVLSYQFDKQLMSRYLAFFNVDYEKFYVEQDAHGKYFLLPFDAEIPHEAKFIEHLKEKIHILYDDELNEIGNPVGNRYTALSYNWWRSNRAEKSEQMNKNITNFFRYKTDVPATERAWTSFKTERSSISGKYLNKKHWVPFNARATNQYRGKTVIAYCVNRYHKPTTKSFFSRRNLTINDDDFALSEMLQFVFRFAIRDGKDIHIYIPSSRMRGILECYLNGEEPSEYRKYVK